MVPRQKYTSLSRARFNPWEGISTSGSVLREVSPEGHKYLEQGCDLLFQIGFGSTFCLLLGFRYGVLAQIQESPS